MVYCFLARVRVDHDPRHAARAFRFVDAAIAKARRAENFAGATAAQTNSGLANFAGRQVSWPLIISTAAEGDDLVRAQRGTRLIKFDLCANRIGERGIALTSGQLQSTFGGFQRVGKSAGLSISRS